MNDREKILSWIVAAGVGISVLFFVVQGVAGRFNTLSTSITNVEQEIQSKETTKNRMNNDRDYLAASLQRSLLSDPDAAQTQYEAWIGALAATSSNPGSRRSNPLLTEFQIKSGRYTPVSDSHYRHTFRIVGISDLDRITRFLHAFYSAPIMHRIQELVLTPQTGKSLRVTATVQAIGMLDADLAATFSNEPTEDVLVHDSLEKYRDLILKRNLFGPPNKVPSFTNKPVFTFDTGKQERRVTITGNAGESDQEIASITIDESKSDLPEMPTLQIRGNSASFQIQSEEETEYKFTVLIKDSGFPQKDATREFTIQFRDPPPPTTPTVRKEFDAAKLAYFSATVQINDLLEAWVVRRETGKLLKLHIGDEIEIGTMYGIIDRISFKELEIDTPDGFMLIKQGQNLAEAVNLTAAAEALLDDPRAPAAGGVDEDDLR